MHSPHLDFVSKVLPLVGLRQSKEFLPSTSLESSPSLLFVNGALPLVGLR
ncbi:Hypothetical protein FKW44_004578 [Caligus rogercresseyi]|uniref:Uncharacterized protein n=1 Tax=Caligus rogercresseyi TaxID=217165 RepID=A0A7T8HLR8_CALRO|nr:Hypothetical protein FKW44_004578 [Caligus rogercresseyi]